MKNIKKSHICFIVITLTFITWLIWSNMTIETNHYTISSPKIPSSFSEYKIALVTDLHNYEIGKNNETLIEMIQESNPDIIAIVGDIVDCNHTDLQVSIEFAEQCVSLAPTYYVTGNHEAFIDDYDNLETELASVGVTILNDKVYEIEKNNEYINLLGVNDPSFSVDYFTGDSASAVSKSLDELNFDSEQFSILLSHRPELFDVYVEHNMNLVLTGHAHGGQFRLPFIGGIYSPNQGLFPKYDAGLFTENETNMIVSRGLGNSAFPIRFNNRPELILIELRTDSQ